MIEIKLVGPLERYLFLGTTLRSIQSKGRTRNIIYIGWLVEWLWQCLCQCLYNLSCFLQVSSLDVCSVIWRAACTTFKALQTEQTADNFGTATKEGRSLNLSTRETFKYAVWTTAVRCSVRFSARSSCESGRHTTSSLATFISSRRRYVVLVFTWLASSIVLGFSRREAAISWEIRCTLVRKCNAICRHQCPLLLCFRRRRWFAFRDRFVTPWLTAHLTYAVAFILLFFVVT